MSVQLMQDCLELLDLYRALMKTRVAALQAENNALRYLLADALKEQPASAKPEQRKPAHKGINSQTP